MVANNEGVQELESRETSCSCFSLLGMKTRDVSCCQTGIKLSLKSHLDLVAQWEQGSSAPNRTYIQYILFPVMS
jgi:hypothetical protein